MSQKEKKSKKAKIDYSLISFPYNFESEIRDYSMNCVFRYQTFKELKEWGDTFSPNSKIHPTDKADKMLKMLVKILIEPKEKEFTEFFENLYEPEIADFLHGFTSAKESERKK